MPLPPAYYQSNDVVSLARDLLGRELVTRIDGVITSGVITETEAYRGPEDRASHAWNNRRTSRTEVMFGAGGHAYVYLCYGIHQMMNVVTGPEDVPHAILIRAVHPLEGLEAMLHRRRLDRPRKGWTSGPGTVGQALGLHTRLTGSCLYDPDSPVQIRAGTERPRPGEILAGPRVGIDYAGEDARLPWRFRWLPSR
ncbi:MAG: DNA-3-methyladenine glycosylase [Lewinellaceae bacterium]|nr:DNA-3-methyladenine glycosylase [Lewinellaceae bacterium]